MVTDRGPNGQIKVDDKNRRTFPIPEFDPLILHVQAVDGTIKVLETLPILTSTGKPVTGLSNLSKRDETPYDYSAKTTLYFNQNGLDTEGLVRTSQGDFWLDEEYGPSLLHVDKTGKVIKRYIPDGLTYDAAGYLVENALPAIYAKRKGNRGFEGLALSTDEKLLYANLQSPLSNPDSKVGDASRNTRILVFDIAQEMVTAEYVYQFDEAKAFGGEKNTPIEMKLSAVVALNPTTLLIDERTDALAKLYTVDLSKATNILGTKWDDVKTEKSLESLTDLDAGLALPKTLVLDLSQFKSVPGKIEGVAVLDKNTIAVANDNDFDIGTFDDSGNNKGAGTKSQLFVIKLDKPLP
jgi:hypothetical protein